jgi:SAM-dependent methyltransferase
VAAIATTIAANITARLDRIHCSMRRMLLAALFIGGLLFVCAEGLPIAIAQSKPTAEPDVIYVPTPQPVVDAMLEVAGVTATDIVYDLGSGDGRIVITAAKKYGARGVGIEIDPALVKTATEHAAAAGVSDRVRFVTQDLFTTDLKDATVVTLYLLQSINERLRPKLVRELKPGARVVSHVFNMGPEWPAEKTLMVERSRIFFWTIR